MKKSTSITNIITQNGDLIFDLCISMIEDPNKANHTFTAILKEIRNQIESSSVISYQRMWILRIATHHLLRISKPVDRSKTENEAHKQHPSQQHLFPQKPQQQQFEMIFKKLPRLDQLMFLLKEKHKIPIFEISGALDLPTETIKTKRQQALRTIEDWIWNQQ